LNYFNGFSYRERPTRATFSEAIATLENLRNNPLAINTDFQFDFRDAVEPVNNAPYLLLALQFPPQCSNRSTGIAILGNLETLTNRSNTSLKTKSK
jgi:hypothetical protein